MFADKTTDLYEIPPNDYKRLLHGNITKIYKKSTEGLENDINMSNVFCRDLVQKFTYIFFQTKTYIFHK